MVAVRPVNVRRSAEHLKSGHPTAVSPKVLSPLERIAQFEQLLPTTPRKIGKHTRPISRRRTVGLGPGRQPVLTNGGDGDAQRSRLLLVRYALVGPHLAVTSHSILNAPKAIPN